MKTLNFLLLGASAVSIVAFSSCSGNDDPSEEAMVKTDKQIRFAASAEPTRAPNTTIHRTDYTTNNLTTFNVYAYTGNATEPKLFMDDVVVTKNATNVWTYSPVQYWPANEAVDFYAYAPAGWLGDATPIMPVPYDARVGLTDLIYAVNPNLKGNNGSPNAQVLFTFKHALSKVIIKLSSTNDKLQVRVSNVAATNLMAKGNFHFPGESTAESVNPHNEGYWTDQNTSSTYLYYVSQTAEDVITLTSTPNDLSDSSLKLGGAKYLIPQKLVWNNGEITPSDTYMAVMCSVYDAQTGTKLWPNANTPEENKVQGSMFEDGLLKFPLSTAAFNEWQPGYQYVYNVVINSNNEMGAIEFGDPSVDTFVSVDANYH